MDTPFGRAQKAALRMMRTRMWQKALAEEDPLMVAHFPQLVRINKLERQARRRAARDDLGARVLPRVCAAAQGRRDPAVDVGPYGQVRGESASTPWTPECSPTLGSSA